MISNKALYQKSINVTVFLFLFAVLGLLHKNLFKFDKAVDNSVQTRQRQIVRHPIALSICFQDLIHPDPVLHLVLTVRDLAYNVSYRKTLLSTGDLSASDYFDFLDDSILIEKKSVVQVGTLFESCYNLRLFFPANAVLSSSELNSNVALDYEARVDYVNISSALIDLDDLKEKSFINGKKVAESVFIQFSSKDSTVLLDSWFKSWFLSSGITSFSSNLGFDVNYMNKQSVDDVDFSKCPAKLKTLITSHINGSRSSASESYRYELYTLSDSQHHNECQDLQSKLNFTKDGLYSPIFWTNDNKLLSVSVTCLKIGGSKTQNKAFYFNRLSQNLDAIKPKSENASRILLLNLSDLWDVAYGTYYRDNGALLSALSFDLLVLILSRTSKLGFEKVFYLTTTWVNPITYRGLAKDRSKQAMTQPRVEYINRLMRKVIAEHFEEQITILETGEVSKVGEGDPLSDGDMRHYGVVTNMKIISFILCQVFNRFM